MIEIRVELDPQIDPVSPSDAKHIAKTFFSESSLKSIHVTMIFTTDEYVSDLKQEFFHVNQYTDVMAFRLDGDTDDLEGEIYISVPRAKENAKTFGEPFKKELARLIIHGCLHLIGYDDNTREEKDIMTELENEWLKKTDWLQLIQD